MIASSGLTLQQTWVGSLQNSNSIKTYNLSLCVCVCVYVYADGCRCPWRPEEGTLFSRAGITGSCELSGIGSSAKAAVKSS